MSIFMGVCKYFFGEFITNQLGYRHQWITSMGRNWNDGERIGGISGHKVQRSYSIQFGELPSGNFT